MKTQAFCLPVLCPLHLPFLQPPNELPQIESILVHCAVRVAEQMSGVFFVAGERIH